MKDFALIMASLKSRWLNSLLSVFLTAFGVMLAILIVQFGQHVQSRLSTDGQNIDIVVGAKGSPLQLILSSVYHIDIPTGNIPYETAEKWMNHRQVKTAIPLALGDNWHGNRIVGTTPAYLAHYDASLGDGRLWSKPFEAISGASVNAPVGFEFAGAHGLMDGGHVHEEEKYKIVGTLKPTGTVLDRLILTSLDSVLHLHGHKGVEHEEGHTEHEHHEHEHHDEHKDHDDHSDHEGHEHHDDHEEHAHHDEHKDHDDHSDHEGHEHHDDHDDHAHHDEHKDHDDHSDHEGHEHHDDHDDHAQDAEITALLLTTKSPMANMNLPRMINRESALQAANPALEMVRLTSMLGLGSKTFGALSTLLIIIAALSIFTGLAGSLENRMGDLAVLRAIGYSKARLRKIILTEGMLIVTAGLLLGLVLGLYGFTVMAHSIAPLSASGAQAHITTEICWIIVAVLFAGILASLMPAIRASRVDVAKQLTKGN